MFLRPRVTPLAIVALCVGPLTACFGDPAGLEACTFTDPTLCDEPGATSSGGGSSGPATGSTTGETSGGEPGNEGSGGVTGAETTGEGTAADTGAPIDRPPRVDALVLDPPQTFEVGPTIITYTASADAVSAQLLDDGAMIAEVPAGEPLVFPVTSAPHNNPGSMLTVVVRDEAGQTGSRDIYQPSNVKPPGSHVWTTQEPGDGALSIGGAVALQGALAVSVGVRFQNGKTIGTLRRYDQAGKWKGSDTGWTKDHPSWTKLPELAGGDLSLSAVAVDAQGFIVTAGTALIGGQTRMYVARFEPSGARDWELLEGVGTAGRGVAVQPDGTIYVTGSLSTGEAPQTFDLKTWVYDKDRTAHGSDTFRDPADAFEWQSERGRAVAALKDGRVVVVGTAEVKKNQQAPANLRTVAILYEGKGTRVGVWTSPGDKMLHDAGLAAVPTDEGFALCGYAQGDGPNGKTQILIRWFGADLKESKAPRLELTPGAAASCNALGFNRDSSVIVGAEVDRGPQGVDIWIFAVRDAAAPLVEYMSYNGAENGSDRLLGLACDYMCAWVGAEQVKGALQWLAGMIRG